MADKRARQEGLDADGPDVGPPRPPPGAADYADDEAGPVLGPAPPKPKKKKVLEFEHVYLDALPSAEMYEKSYMHRDVVTHVVATKTDFLITGSADGHLKFWKKLAEGIEFVKHYRSHLLAIEALVASHDGLVCATVSRDKSAKIYDVLNFDMTGMIKLTFIPGCAEFISATGEARRRLAVADAESPSIYVLDASSADAAPLHKFEVHARPVRAMRYNAPFDTVISGDTSGMLEYWAGSDFSFPSDVAAFEFKSETHLYALAKAKAAVRSIEVSADGEQFSVCASDKRVRVFRFLTGKLRRCYDESADAANELQRSEAPLYHLEAIDFGRRVAIERELDGDAEAAPPNAVFDESGNFLIYPTLLGIKVVNLVTNRVARVLGKVENTERFLRVSLLQSAARKKARVAGSAEVQKLAEKDPLVVAVAFRKARFYLFSRREPDDAEDASKGRDVFNEKPPADELQGLAAAAPANLPNLAQGAVLHTTLGDIHVKLYRDEVPKTVENFTVHARNGYFDGLIFHRVIKGFMVQTGDPLGDGTGGSSIWGGEFADEFVKTLRHDRPFTLSMANAGPNTNGSQFFITTVACPWLDGKHTVWGRVTKGTDVVQAIEKVKTDSKGDKPLTDIKILNITLEM